MIEYWMGVAIWASYYMLLFVPKPLDWIWTATLNALDEYTSDQ